MCMAFHFTHLTLRTQANLLSDRAGDSSSFPKFMPVWGPKQA